MKNKILIIILLFINYYLNAQYTAIPDFCFESILIETGIDTEGIEDGQVLTSDIANVTSLDLSYFPQCNVTDTTGIDGFTNLEYLYANYTSISSVDLSNNIHLKEITFLECNLQNINVNNCTELTYLSLVYNQISSIDLSDNVNLELLNLIGNNLTAIDLTNNINIINLGLTGNQLTELNVNNIITLETLTCGYNLLTSLDISNLINIKVVSFDNNLLQFVDIRNGNNNNITEFHALNNQNLTCIYVDDVQYSQTNWTNIDVTSTFVETEAECEVLAMEDLNLEDNFLIYPNPVKNTLNISNLNNDIKRIVVYDFLGKIILETNENKIDFYNNKEGIYFVKIITKKGVVFNKKIIKIGA